MAKTQLQKFSVQEKLNSMDMDIIDVTPVINNGVAYDPNDWLFVETEIPNAVASDGGCSLLQQINIWDFHGDDDTLVIDLMFWRKDPGDGIGAYNTDALAEPISPADINTYGCHGFSRISGFTKITDDGGGGADINVASVAPIGTKHRCSYIWSCN
mgnify:CR=1 FL=1